MKAAHCNAHKEFDYDCLDCSDALLAQRAVNEVQPVRMNKRLEIPDSLYVTTYENGTAIVRSRSDDAFYARIHGPLADQYAQLFKSAPALLAALKHLMRYDFGDSDGAKEARAAIAQATGETP